ncbi:MAG: peptidylprolyl isomerase [Acidobacteria bacterium]|nr:peptidylprolyl isomerase [Acidobacteriota bacterium]MBI3472377.1 peptidylprolyl isomerase [Candidatus Solibacter usitatus]
MIPTNRLAAGGLLLVAAACRTSPPVNVAAMVNNRPITYQELEKNFRARFDPSSEGSSEDQIMIQKLEILRGLVDNEIMLQRAEKLGLMAVDADVETKLNEFKSPYTKEEFQKQLEAKKMTLEDLKQQIRRELSIQKLINNVTFHIDITDADVANFYNSNKGAFNFAEPQVHMAQLLVTPLPDTSVRNLKNDKAQNEEEARKKIQMLEQRLKQGEDFAMLAQNYSEDPNTAPNGGDLGFVPQSALEKVPVELRKEIMALQPAQVSRIIRTQAGYSILKVYTKEPSGQRPLNDPRVQQTIRETLRNRKDQLLKAAYYEVARNEAKVLNYLAKSVADAAAKK